MNELCIKSIVVKKFKPYSKNSGYTEGENVLNLSTTGINQKWVGDITYIYTIKHGWIYLASVEDFSWLCDVEEDRYLTRFKSFRKSL